MKPFELRTRLLVFLVFCVSAVEIQAQRIPRIRGNRNVVEVQEQLPPFSRVWLQDNLDIRLQATGEEGYSITADENLIDVLRFEVREGTLYISSFYRIVGSKSLEISVGFQTLEEIHAEAGHLFNEGAFQADLLRISAEADARLSLEFRAIATEVVLGGNSRADLRIEADSLSAVFSGRSDANLYTVNERMRLELAENAGLYLEGISQKADVRLQANTGLRASALEAAELTLVVGESATARVRAVDTFSLDGSGGSRIYLYGLPEIRILRFSDRAELHKETD